MTTMEKPKESSTVGECLGRTMRSALYGAMSEILLLRNGTQVRVNPHHSHHEMAEDFLTETLNMDYMEGTEYQIIEEALPEGDMLKGYGAVKLQTFIRKLCRHILQIVRAAGKDKRLCETKMKNYESARTKERLQLEDCNRKLKEIQN